MPTLDQKDPSWAPAYVVGVYPKIAAKAQELGYALALHGSLQRDLDVIAIPWTDDAVDPIELVQELANIFNIEPNRSINEPVIKSHGRMTWVLPLWWGAYIDLSVMPQDKDKDKEIQP